MLNPVSNPEREDPRMTQKRLRYPTVLFDWDDTVMGHHPKITLPRVEWETIEVIEGMADVLGYLHSSDRRIVLATSAVISDEGQIRGALARGGLDEYFSRIYCFKSTHIQKGEEFLRHILNDWQISASDVLMVGDGFEKDVQVPNRLGIFAVWFNPKSYETRKGELHITVHSMQELRDFFKSLD
jgi:FMN phosphatase YigB (HAD superfamily)